MREAEGGCRNTMAGTEIGHIIKEENAKPLLSLPPVLCPQPWPSTVYPQISFIGSLSLMHVQYWDSPCTSHGCSSPVPFSPHRMSFLHSCPSKYHQVFKAATNDDTFLLPSARSDPSQLGTSCMTSFIFQLPHQRGGMLLGALSDHG